MHRICAHTAAQILFGSAFPLRSPGKEVLGGALLAQLAYDWYWNTRLRASWVKCVRLVSRVAADGAALSTLTPVRACRYCKKIKTLQGGAKKSK